ncbi:hypothetical protein C0214_07825 [Methylobacterium sp. DM1]|nr:hypothetical protein C0214_07825 [Methylobacterium sp. DM1]
MAFGPDVAAALDRLANYHNGGAYDPQNNPGGLANGGRRLRFTPSLADVALVVNAVGNLQSQIAYAQQVLEGMEAYLATIGGVAGLGEALTEKLDRKMLIKASAPVAADIPAGTIRVAKNTATGRTSLFANDGGTIIDLINGQGF